MLVNLRVSEKQKEDIDRIVERLGMKSRSDVLRLGLRFISDLDKFSLSMILSEAHRMRLPAGLVVRNHVLRSLAQSKARRNVRIPTAEVCEDFTFTPEGPLAGAAAYSRLTELFVEREKSEHWRELAVLAAQGVAFDESQLRHFSEDERAGLEKTVALLRRGPAEGK